MEDGNADETADQSLNDSLSQEMSQAVELVTRGTKQKCELCDFEYSRKDAAFPLNWVRDNKFWPTVRRIDQAYGDRNLICSCPSTENYSESTCDI